LVSGRTTILCLVELADLPLVRSFNVLLLMRLV
jgi:hypothetical protein